MYEMYISLYLCDHVLDRKLRFCKLQVSSGSNAPDLSDVLKDVGKQKSLLRTVEKCVSFLLCNCIHGFNMNV